MKKRNLRWQDVFKAAEGNIDKLYALLQMARRRTYEAYQREQNARLSQVPTRQQESAAAARYEELVGKAYGEALDRARDVQEEKRYQWGKERRRESGMTGEDGYA